MDEDSKQRIVAEFAATYPPIIQAEQAVQIAGVPVATVHSWSSLGFFDGIKAKVGRRIRLDRDEYVRFLLGRQS